MISRWTHSASLLVAVGAMWGVTNSSAGQTSQYTVTNLGAVPDAYITSGVRMNNLGHVVGYSIFIRQGEPSIKPWVWTPEDGFTVLPPPPDMYQGRARAMDISDTGIIAGDGGFDAGIAWRYENGVYETFGQVGGMNIAYLGAVNDLGDVVGTAKDSQFTTEDEIFLDINGGETQQLTPGDAGGRGTDINNNGQICGYSQGPMSGFGAFIWDQTNGFEFLGTAGLAYSFANDMNDSGQVVGYAQSASGNTHNSWIYTPGSGQQVLPTRGATAINNLGQVVGTITCCGPDEPWLWTDQGGTVMLWELFDFAAAGLSGPNSRDINDAGQILLSTYDNNAGGYRPVVLTPVPGGSGACCLGEDGCLADASEEDCAAQKGTFLGVGTQCEACIPTGACCLTDGDCLSFTPETECSAMAGYYQGDDTSCAVVGCQPNLPNDDCTDALPIGLGDTAFSTLGASTDGPDLPASCSEPAGVYFGMDVWFLYEPDGNGTLIVSTCNQADYDTRIAAYTGDCDSLEIAGCNDDIPPPTCYYGTSIMDVPVTCGEPVLIRVGSYSVYTGTGTLTLSFDGEPCDPQSDLNGDGRVGPGDLAILLGSWGPCGDCGNCSADLDGDCTVGAADLAMLLGNWG